MQRVGSGVQGAGWRVLGAPGRLRSAVAVLQPEPFSLLSRRLKQLGRRNRFAETGHHRVECAACKCVATLQGTPFGKEIVTHDGRDIVIRQAVRPTSFACPACGLRLNGYAELSAAGVGDQYMRTTRTTPEAFYGLYSEDELNAAIEARLPSVLGEYVGSEMEEYDNEG